MVRRLVVAAVVFGVVGVWVANASRPGSPEGCLATCAPGAERRPGPLRVLSLNVLHGFPTFGRLGERLDLVADEIVRRDADVALLQEVPWTFGTGSAAERLARATGMNHVFARANGQRFAILFEEGSAILSRYPLRDVATTELTPHAGPFEHRIALAATADTPWGALRLVVTHLAGSDEEVNLGQAASLAAWTTAQAGPMLPMLIVGDFNATPESATYASLPSAWTDAYRSVHPDDAGHTCCLDDLEAAPPSVMPGRVDYQFAAGGLTPVSAEVILLDALPVGDGWLRASDHAGLLVEYAPAA